MNHRSFKTVSIAVGLLVLVFHLNSRADDSGVPLHGFTDVTFGGSSKDIPAAQKINNFATGTVDLYLTPDLENNVKSLIEIAFEPNLAVGAVGVDVERLQVGYSFGDFATVWFGRIHAPYGYWNAGFHHGAQIQTSIMRPKFLEFEDRGGILPAHLVGLWLQGKVPVGKSKFTYDIYVTNGSRLTGDNGPEILDPNLVRSGNDTLAVGTNFGLNLGGLFEGLRIGVHSLNMDVNYAGGTTAFDPTAAVYTPTTVIAGTSTRVSMVGGYLVYDANNWEILAELYQFSNQDRLSSSGTKYYSSANYAQVGYGLTNDLKIYARNEQTILDKVNDNYFIGQKNAISYKKNSGGFYYALNAKTAIKFEHIATSLDDASKTSFTSDQIQYAIRF